MGVCGGGAGRTGYRVFLAARAPNGLNDVQGWGLGRRGEMRGADVGWGSTSTNRPSHHKSPKQFLLLAYLEAKKLKGSKSTSCPLVATCLSRF